MRKTADLALTGFFTALLAVCSWISLPFAVPVTLQTFALCLAAGLLGFKRALASVTAYILLGAVGVPVFSGFRGGLSAIASPTGGYIVGFLLAVAVIGFVKDRSGGKPLPLALSMAAGIILCYIFGTAWFMLLFPPEGELTLLATLMSCVFPFVLPDAVKAALSLILIRRLSDLFSK